MIYAIMMSRSLMNSQIEYAIMMSIYVDNQSNTKNISLPNHKFLTERKILDYIKLTPSIDRRDVSTPE